MPGTFYNFKGLFTILIYDILKPYVMGTKGLLRPDKTAPNTYILFVYVFMYGARLQEDKLGAAGYIIIRCGCVVIAITLRLCGNIIYVAAVYIIYIIYTYNFYGKSCSLRLLTVG